MTQAQQEEIIKSSGYKTRDNVLVEDPIQLLYEQKTDLVQQRRSEKPEIVDTIMADANVVIPVSSDAAPEISFISQGPTPEQVAANQKISKNSDGKKRIAPFFVKSLGEDPVEPVSKISLRSTLKRPLEPNELSDIQYILPTIVKNANSPDQIIGIPTIQSKLSTHITVTSNRITKLFNIECSNTKKSSRIFVTLSKELVWEDCLPHPILFITGTEKFIIATCINGYTFFYSSAGRRLLPALKLNGVVSFIDVFQYLALIITNNGDLYTFDLKTCKNIINRENVLCFLSKNVDIVSASIFESVIKITLSDNRVFSFHQEMQSWIDISKSNQIDRALPMLKNGIESMSLIVKMQEIADIENEICCMLYNRDGNNFKELYLLYAQKLADESQHSKIVEVCEEFMNGGDILGNDRIELLRSFLEIFSTNRNLQQIVKLYHDELDGRRKCY